jgi:multifunctional methyltransferase subunit TRM112
MEETEADFNPSFVTKLLSRMDWAAFVQTALSLGLTGLPADLPADFDQDFLQKVHHIALEHKVKEGKMVCNGCGHVYPIIQGIPNMLLTNTEV